MLDARDALDAADRLVAAGDADTAGVDDRREQGGGEEREQALVRELGQQRPQAGERNEEEGRRDRQNQPQPRPDLLEDERPGAAADLALEGRIDGQAGKCFDQSCREPSSPLARASPVSTPPFTMKLHERGGEQAALLRVALVERSSSHPGRRSTVPPPPCGEGLGWGNPGVRCGVAPTRLALAVPPSLPSPPPRGRASVAALSECLFEATRAGGRGRSGRRRCGGGARWRKHRPSTAPRHQQARVVGGRHDRPVGARCHEAQVAGAERRQLAVKRQVVAGLAYWAHNVLHHRRLAVAGLHPPAVDLVRLVQLGRMRSFIAASTIGEGLVAPALL